MSYFPHPEVFFTATGLAPDTLVPGQKVEIDGGVLRHLLSLALAALEIDETAYLRQPDIGAAHAEGRIRNLACHYRETGFFEGRPAVSRRFDSAWYAATYPDVRIALDDGRIDSAIEHYLSRGAREWRAPSGPAGVEVALWRGLLQQ